MQNKLMNRDLPMHALSTKTNASHIAFILVYISAQGLNHSVLHLAGLSKFTIKWN